MLDQAYDRAAQDRTLQLALLELNRLRLTPAFPVDASKSATRRIYELSFLEADFLENLRSDIAEEAASAPLDADAFLQWFSELERTGPGQHDPLFSWLAEEATLDDMKWFLTQEVAGEAGFEDLTALTQVRFPAGPKLEMARNYWDEMGRGNPKGMHGPLLTVLMDGLALTPRSEDVVPEALMLGNLMAGLAANRCYAYHSVGALGVIELTAPARAACVNVGLKRLGIDPALRHYYSLHAVLDVKRSQTWNSEVIRPLFDGALEATRAIAEGALMRLDRGAACFKTYRRHLWGADSH